MIYLLALINLILTIRLIYVWFAPKGYFPKDFLAFWNWHYISIEDYLNDEKENES